MCPSRYIVTDPTTEAQMNSKDEVQTFFTNSVKGCYGVICLQWTTTRMTDDYR